MNEAELKEYEALRQEIQYNLKGMQLLLYFAMAAVGGIFSYGIVAENGYVFLIGPVIVIACVEYTWMLMLVVVRISTYIRVVLEKQISGLKWETFMFDVRKNKIFGWERQRRLHYGAILAVYDTLAVGCIVASLVFANWNIVIPVSACIILLLVWVNYGLFKSTHLNKFEEEEKKIKTWIQDKAKSNKGKKRTSH